MPLHYARANRTSPSCLIANLGMTIRNPLPPRDAVAILVADEVDDWRMPLRPTHLALLLCAVIAGAAALAIQDSLVGDRYMTDDAYISFRYARHLADGLGPVWSNGSSVEGYTNFGWILLLAGALKVGIGPVLASRLFGLAASVGVLALVPVLASQLRPVGSSVRRSRPSAS